MKIKISKIKERLQQAGTQYGQRPSSDAKDKVWHKVESRMHQIDLSTTENVPNNFWQIWNRRLSVVGGLAILIIALSTGVVHASNNSLPGDLLYPVNLALDKVTEKLIHNPQRKAEFKLKQAEERMDKVVETSKPSDQNLIERHERAVVDFEDSLDTSEEFLLILKVDDEDESEVKRERIEKMQEKFDNLNDRYEKLKDDEYRELLEIDDEVDGELDNDERKDSNKSGSEGSNKDNSKGDND